MWLFKVNMWRLKKEVAPQICDPPMAKKDEHGNIVTDPEKLMDLYVATYEKRLKNKEIKQDLDDIKYLKEELLKRRMKIAKRKKSKAWTMKQLNKVLKSLKKNKARDPIGWPNELFRLENAGEDLKCSLLKLVNCIKTEQYLPKLLRSPDITCIFKKREASMI